MKTIEIKNFINGSIIHSFTSKNATIKDAVEDAVKNGISLEYADLRSADLRLADLRLADLSLANLRSADLYSANLRSADLSSANLHSADLSFANLYSANLSSVIKLPMYCKWTHGITNGNLIHIGCEQRTIEEWDKFFESDEIITTKRGTDEFKQIQAVYEAYKSYLTFLNK